MMKRIDPFPGKYMTWSLWLWAFATGIYVFAGQPESLLWNIAGGVFLMWVVVFFGTRMASARRSQRRATSAESGALDHDLQAESD